MRKLALLVTALLISSATFAENSPAQDREIERNTRARSSEDGKVSYRILITRGGQNETLYIGSTREEVIEACAQDNFRKKCEREVYTVVMRTRGGSSNPDAGGPGDH